ncbi:hypothetical protein ABZ639_09650 [Saccharomonospora sp. NPDC006951]
MVALTDSGYLANRNWAGLRTILRGAACQSVPTIAMLPLAARWFATPVLCETLAHEINSYGVPVAFAIEHASDPFRVQYVIRGFLQILDSVAVPVLLLRCDVSALGALCHGAYAAAIGTGSGLRHFYPIRTGSTPRLPGISAFVGRLLSYHRLDTCERIFTRTPDIDHFWPCHCPVCGGATPERLRTADDPQTASFQHSLHTLFQLQAELSYRARTREERISSWHDVCSHALYVHDQVAESMDGWQAPTNLRAWYSVTTDPFPHRASIPRQTRARASSVDRTRVSE